MDATVELNRPRSRTAEVIQQAHALNQLGEVDAVDQQAHALDQPDESDCAHEAVGDENETNDDEPLFKQGKRVLAMLPCGRASK